MRRGLSDDAHGRSSVAVAKGARGQARQEEPKLDLARNRGWCQRREHDPGGTRRGGHFGRRGECRVFGFVVMRDGRGMPRVSKRHGRPTLRSRSFGI